MQETKPCGWDFIILNSTDGRPVSIRSDMLSAVWGPEGDRRNTRVTVRHGKGDIHFDVTDRPEDIPGPLATFNGTGGGLVRLRPDFVVAMSGRGDGKGTVIYTTAADSNQWNVRQDVQTVAESLRRVQAQINF